MARTRRTPALTIYRAYFGTAKIGLFLTRPEAEARVTRHAIYNGGDLDTDYTITTTPLYDTGMVPA